MNRPPLQTRVSGHPVSVFLVGSLVALSLCVVVSNTDAWPMLLICGLTMNRVMQAHEAVIAYQHWQAEWDAMAPDHTPPRRRSRRGLAVVLFMMFAIFTGYTLDGAAVRHAAPAVALFAVLGAVIATLWLCGRWIRRCRRSRRRSFVVTVIARAVMPAPKLVDAYRTLPPYCHALLRGQK